MNANTTNTLAPTDDSGFPPEPTEAHQKAGNFPPVQIRIADDLPPCLLVLTPQQRAWLNSSIGNDEVSSDEEIQTHWITEFGLSEEQASEAIGYRDRCLMPFFQLFPEVMTDLYDHA